MDPEWPIRTDAGGVDASGRPSGGDGIKGDASPGDMLGHAAVSARRLRDATTDLMLPASHRLSDRVRTLALNMLGSVVNAAERDIRRAVVPVLDPATEAAASFASRTAAIAGPLLSDAGLLAHDPLVDIILRYARMSVLSARIVAARPERAPDGLPADDDDPNIAQAASALRVASSKARDGFGEPTLAMDDLPAELAHRLVWQVAAALRYASRRSHRNGDLDEVIGAAATAKLAMHDEGQGMEALAGKFVRALDAKGRLDDTVLENLLMSGEVRAFTAGLALRAGLPFAVVWAILDAPNEGRLALLLRAANVARVEAGAILMTFHDDARVEAAVDRYDRTNAAFGRASVAPLAMDTAYAEAIGALAASVPLANGAR